MHVAGCNPCRVWAPHQGLPTQRQSASGCCMRHGWGHPAWRIRHAMRCCTTPECVCPTAVWCCSYERHTQANRTCPAPARPSRLRRAKAPLRPHLAVAGGGLLPSPAGCEVAMEYEPSQPLQVYVVQVVVQSLGPQVLFRYLGPGRPEAAEAPERHPAWPAPGPGSGQGRSAAFTPLASDGLHTCPWERFNI